MSYYLDCGVQLSSASSPVCCPTLMNKIFNFFHSFLTGSPCRMSFQDFTQEFQKLEICNLGPDSLDEDDLSNKKRWEVHKEHSQWVKRVSAGGCRNYLGVCTAA